MTEEQGNTKQNNLNYIHTVFNIKKTKTKTKNKKKTCKNKVKNK